MLAVVPRLAFAAALGGVSAAAAQTDGAGFEFSGAQRTRFETLDPQFRAGFSNSDQAAALQTTLVFNWRRDSWQVGGEIMDSRSLWQRRGLFRERHDDECARADCRLTSRGGTTPARFASAASRRTSASAGSSRATAIATPSTTSRASTGRGRAPKAAPRARSTGCRCGRCLRIRRACSTTSTSRTTRCATRRSRASSISSRSSRISTASRLTSSTRRRGLRAIP